MSAALGAPGTGEPFPARYPMRPVARPNPAVLVWRWRWELGLIAVAGGVIVALARAIGLEWTVCTLSAMAGVVSVWPSGRRCLARRAWCIFTAHRVRTGCAQACIRSASGKLPLVLTTTAQPFGQRVLMWCRAGTSAEDFAAARGMLAAACWATEVTVSPRPGRPQIVALDVVRRAEAHRSYSDAA